MIKIPIPAASGRDFKFKLEKKEPLFREKLCFISYNHNSRTAIVNGDSLWLF